MPNPQDYNYLLGPPIIILWSPQVNCKWGVKRAPEPPFHVHQWPVDTAYYADDLCGASSVGGHYDPTMKGAAEDYATRCGNDPAECEEGDLSGKLGPIPAAGSLAGATPSAHLSLQGPKSIVGRSIVVHASDGARLACATIVQALPETFLPRESTAATASFASNDFAASIVMQQRSAPDSRGFPLSTGDCRAASADAVDRMPLNTKKATKLCFVFLQTEDSAEYRRSCKVGAVQRVVRLVSGTVTRGR